MYDFSSNGTGKSRYLKSVSNFLTQYPTYEDFAKALIDGTLPVDFNGYNANGILSRGTPYNKANVLTDETALLFGLDNNATVNQVLNLLGRDYGSASNYYGASSTAGGTRAKTVTVSNKFQLSEGARVTVRFTNGNTATNPTLNVNSTGAKAIRAASSGTGVNTVFSWASGMIVEFVYDGNYWIMTAPYGANNQVSSDVISALNLSSGATVNDAFVTAASTMAKKSFATSFVSGTYEGDGSYGSGSQKSFSLPGYVQFGIIVCSTYADYCIMCGTSVVSSVSGKDAVNLISSNTQNIYSITYTGSDTSYGARYQMNSRSRNYEYMFLVSLNPHDRRYLYGENA